MADRQVHFEVEEKEFERICDFAGSQGFSTMKEYWLEAERQYRLAHTDHTEVQTEFKEP